MSRQGRQLGASEDEGVDASPRERRPELQVRAGLTRRTAIASGFLMLVLAAGFLAVLLAINNLRESTQSRRDTRQALVVANELETLVIDLETGVRGFVIARDDGFLEPWRDARAAFPGQARELERLVAGEPVELALLRRIEQKVASYIRDYSLPLVDAVRRNDPSASSAAETTEGKRRVDAIRAEFDAFLAEGNRALTAHERSAENAGRLAIVGAGVGAAGSVLLILLFAGYLMRVIVRPVRRTALMADRLAGGDLGTRMMESGPAEIGALERSFNVMADSLEKDRYELAASRARIVATADETRRRIERDLHDGAQQRIVALALELRAAQAAVPPGLGELEAELSSVAKGLASVLDELREMARGIHPAILAEGGLGPALKTLARRSPIPVELNVRADARLPERVEVAAYYVISETLTNAAKHAHASVIHVDVEAVDLVLRVSVRDDGAGGADPTRGSGLVGLQDRVEALGGTISVQSALGTGTSVRVELPLDH